MGDPSASVPPPENTMSGLQELLTLATIADCDVFTGNVAPMVRPPLGGARGWIGGKLYGGHVLAQALVAASATVPPSFRAHSLHGFFILAGETDQSLMFEVDRVRDGKSFATRCVSVVQSQKVVFQMSASYTMPDTGPEFQTPVGTLQAIMDARGRQGKLARPEELYAKGVPIEPISPADTRQSTESMVVDRGKWWSLRWCRHRTSLPESQQQSVFAWMSNAALVELALNTHRTFYNVKLGFSLGHTVHFHRAFCADEWLLLHARMTVSAEARGLVWLEAFTCEGTLVATVTQEVLLRMAPKDTSQTLPVLGLRPPPGPPPGHASDLEVSLGLEQIAGCDVFTGTEKAIGRTIWGRVYGGHVFAQSLVAAQRTVPAGFHPHSLHGYFILSGKSGVKIVFEVERVRDGTTFATRTVKALQGNGAIFQLNASFTKGEPGPSFRTPGREVIARARSRGLAEDDGFPLPEELLARGVATNVAVLADNRGATESLTIAEGDWWHLRWVRHRTPLHDNLHEAIFAWISDGGLVTNIRKPYEKSYPGLAPGQGMSMSLDHTIYFHQPFRVDDWLLLETRSSVSAECRGLARHEVFDRHGVLVATVLQEGLIRPARL